MDLARTLHEFCIDFAWTWHEFGMEWHGTAWISHELGMDYILYVMDLAWNDMDLILYVMDLAWICNGFGFFPENRSMRLRVLRAVEYVRKMLYIVT